MQQAKTSGLVYNSDQGSQYWAYQTALGQAQWRCSTTDSYDCYQDALAKRVSGILKDEFLFLLLYDLTQAQLLVKQVVHLYNEERPCLALNYLNPDQVHQPAKSPAGKSERGPGLISINI